MDGAYTSMRLERFESSLDIETAMKEKPTRLWASTYPSSGFI
jgi:hypothetical protein